MSSVHRRGEARIEGPESGRDHHIDRAMEIAEERPEVRVLKDLVKWHLCRASRIAEERPVLGVLKVSARRGRQDAFRNCRG